MRHPVSNARRLLRGPLLAALATTALQAGAAGIQVGPSGKTYADSALSCALHPTAGLSPQVMAGLYQPTKRARATVSLNGVPLAKVTAAQPDATVWLAAGPNTVQVALSARVADRYTFDATPTFPGQPNVCIPDTRGNSVSGDLETAASGTSYTTVTPGCALNPQTGLAQPYVTLFDNGGTLLNVSLNTVPLTQLSSSRPRATLFLAAGLNVVTVAAGSLFTDAYVRDGGSGSCTLP